MKWASRHAGAIPHRADLRVAEQGVATRVELSTGSGKTMTSLSLVRHLARANRQVLIVAPTVIETIQAARRLQVLVTTSRVSHGVDLSDGVRSRRVRARASGGPSAPSGYTKLQRVAPELFAVARRRPEALPVGGPDQHLHRAIRRLLVHLDISTGSLVDLLAAAVRRLLSGAHAQVDRAASACGQARTNVPSGVPVPARPQLTRGPTLTWTNSILSVYREPAYA